VALGQEAALEADRGERAPMSDVEVDRRVPLLVAYALKRRVSRHSHSGQQLAQR
jgi:hypothetical protein